MKKLFNTSTRSFYSAPTMRRAFAPHRGIQTYVVGYGIPLPINNFRKLQSISNSRKPMHSSNNSYHIYQFSVRNFPTIYSVHTNNSDGVLLSMVNPHSGTTELLLDERIIGPFENLSYMNDYINLTASLKDKDTNIDEINETRQQMIKLLRHMNINNLYYLYGNTERKKTNNLASWALNDKYIDKKIDDYVGYYLMGTL